MKREEILDEVKRIITKDRQDLHGKPEDSFGLIAQAWTAYLQDKGLLHPVAAVLPYQVAEMMAELKECRHRINPENPDNRLDQIGYLALSIELRDKAEGTVATTNHTGVSEYVQVVGRMKRNTPVDTVKEPEGDAAKLAPMQCPSLAVVKFHKDFPMPLFNGQYLVSLVEKRLYRSYENTWNWQSAQIFRITDDIDAVPSNYGGRLYDEKTGVLYQCSPVMAPRILAAYGGDGSQQWQDELQHLDLTGAASVKIR